MIELVFIVCLTTMPASCEERVLSFIAASSPVACLMQAQPELANWAREHPGYTIKHWQCQPPGRRKIAA
jgi:hypothetical protein